MIAELQKAADTAKVFDRLPIGATKAEELAHLRRFIYSCDIGTYLRSFFEGGDDIIARELLNDSCCVAIPYLRRINSQLNEDERDARKRLKELEEANKKLRQEHDILMISVCRARDAAREIGSALATVSRDFQHVQKAAQDIGLDEAIKTARNGRR